MGMDNRKTSGGSFVAALVFFVMTASIAGSSQQNARQPATICNPRICLVI